MFVFGMLCLLAVISFITGAMLDIPGYFDTPMDTASYTRAGSSHHPDARLPSVRFYKT